MQKSESQVEMTNDMLACLRAYVTSAWRMAPKRGGRTSKSFLAKLKSGSKTRKRKQGPRLTELDTKIGQVMTLFQPQIRNFRIKRTLADPSIDPRMPDGGFKVWFSRLFLLKCAFLTYITTLSRLKNIFKWIGYFYNVFLGRASHPKAPFKRAEEPQDKLNKISLGWALWWNKALRQTD